jgi:hypothetical protein
MTQSGVLLPLTASGQEWDKSDTGAIARHTARSVWRQSAPIASTATSSSGLSLGIKQTRDSLDLQERDSHQIASGSRRSPKTPFDLRNACAPKEEARPAASLVVVVEGVAHERVLARWTHTLRLTEFGSFFEALLTRALGVASAVLVVLNANRLVNADRSAPRP